MQISLQRYAQEAMSKLQDAIDFLHSNMDDLVFKREDIPSRPIRAEDSYEDKNRKIKAFRAIEQPIVEKFRKELELLLEKYKFTLSGDIWDNGSAMVYIQSKMSNLCYYLVELDCNNAWVCHDKE